MLSALIIGGVVCTALATAGAFISDLKVGYWLGSTPRSQERYKFIGILVAAFCVTGVLLLLNKVYGFTGPDALAAPQANAMAAVIKVLMTTATAPWFLYLAGIFMAITLELIKVPPLPFALGMYLPIELNTPLLVGGFVAHLVSTRSKNEEVNTRRRERGTLVASGFIAGGALMGVVSALIALPGWNETLNTGIGGTAHRRDHQHRPLPRACASTCTTSPRRGRLTRLRHDRRRRGRSMKRFIASLVYAIDRRMPRPRVGGRESSEAYSLWEYRIGKGILESYADRLGDLDGKRVLDIGCGLGGKTVAYAEAGARVTGVDISEENISRCFEFARARGRRGGFRRGGRASGSLRRRDLRRGYRERFARAFRRSRAARSASSRACSAPGGSIFLFFTPWGSPLGSHLYDYIRTPWCHLLFPEWLLRRSLERALAARGIVEPARERSGSWTSTTRSSTGSRSALSRNRERDAGSRDRHGGAEAGQVHS